MEQESISTTRIGSFRVLRRLASGATTDVLLARAEGSDRLVALKVLLQQFRSDPAFEQMFVREAAAYAGLSHPAIVRLYDFFSIDGQFVMVLEYVDGLPLHKLRAMLSIGGEKVEDSAALFIGSRIFEALAAAHSARDPASGELAPVIHRDLNPSNVLVPWDVNVKVSDFGIAKAGETRADTKMGFVKGTYGYLAPEQVKGENVTVRADIYAGSLLLWELLARRKAIQRGAMSEVGVLNAMAQPDFPSLDLVRPDIDPAVRDAVGRGLAVNPNDRSITAEEMVGLLAGAMKEGEGRAILGRAIARVRPAPSEATGDSGGFKGAEVSVERAVNGSSAPAPSFSISPVPTPVADSSPAAPARSSAPVPLIETQTSCAPTAPQVDPDSAPASLASGSGHSATPTVPAASATAPIPGRAGPPRRDLALVVVLLSALVGVAVVAFYLWSEEGSLPASPATGAPIRLALESTPPPPASVPLSIGSATAPGGGPLKAAAPAGASSSAASDTLGQSASVGAPLPVAMAAGSDPEAAAAALGDIFTAPSGGGHRIFIDGRVVGESPDLIRVRCGRHEVRVGGNGLSQTIDVPCGGSLLVTPKWPAPAADRPPP